MDLKITMMIPVSSSYVDYTKFKESIMDIAKFNLKMSVTPGRPPSYKLLSEYNLL
jgi:hypothetical protein